MKIPSFLLSSSGVGLAMRVKAVAGLIVSVLALVGVSTSEDAVNSLADQVELALGAVGTLVSVVFAVKGQLRANFNRANKLGKFAEK